MEVLVNNRELADYYEKICTELGEAAKAEKTKGDFKKLVKLASNYLINDYLALRILKMNWIQFWIILIRNKLFKEIRRIIF